MAGIFCVHVTIWARAVAKDNASIMNPASPDRGAFMATSPCSFSPLC
jgi:hypothetical protein